MKRYAERTEVPIDKSQAEIRRVLVNNGAQKLQIGEDLQSGDAYVFFMLDDRLYKIHLPMPTRNDSEVTRTPTGKTRTKNSADQAYTQACRQRWRALLFIMKAKLEYVSYGISSVEEQFLADLVLPDGSTVGTFIQPQIEIAYRDGSMPPLLAWEGKEG